MAVDESDTSSAAQGAADEERWQTYLHYDQNVMQAVKRLGALSGNYVDEFRDVLMKGRDRTRIKEYEAETIRRLQGEAFVGDHELQLAFAFLHSEDPRLGEEFQKLVSTSGRPDDIDQAVAAIRASRAQGPVKAEKPRLVVVENPKPPQVAQPAPAKAETPPPVLKPVPPKPVSLASVTQTPVTRAPVTQTPAAPVSVTPPAVTAPPPVMMAPRAFDEAKDSTPRGKRLALMAAIVIAAGAGLVIAWPKLIGDVQHVAIAPPVPASPAVPEQAAMPAPAPSVQRTSPTPAIRAAASEPSPARGNVPNIPAPATMPDTPPTPVPVPGASYKVVRGDMLSAISKAAYGDASKFRLIQRANPSLRNGPDMIYYDQVIAIPKLP